MGEAITGPLLKHLGNIRWQYVLSVAGLMLFTGLMYLADENRQNMAVAVSVLETRTTPDRCQSRI